MYLLPENIFWCQLYNCRQSQGFWDAEEQFWCWLGGAAVWLYPVWQPEEQPGGSGEQLHSDATHSGRSTIWHLIQQSHCKSVRYSKKFWEYRMGCIAFILTSSGAQNFVNLFFNLSADWKESTISTHNVLDFNLKQAKNSPDNIYLHLLL